MVDNLNPNFNRFNGSKQAVNPWDTAPVPENINAEQAEVMFYLNTVYANLAMGVDAIMQVAIEGAENASDRDRNVGRHREAIRYLGSSWWRVRDAVCDATTATGDGADDGAGS